MSRRDPNRKLNFQRTQIRSILTDFRKAKHKCIQLYEELNEEMPDKIRFDSVERETILKMELLDLPGLVTLKNILLKTLAELFELQSQISTKKQRIAAKKQVGGMYLQKNLAVNHTSHTNKNYSMNYAENPRKKHFEQQEQYHKAGALNQKKPNTNKQLKLSIPTYDIQHENNENKLDRISNFVTNLQKNMKDQSQEKEEEVKLQEILLNEPQYCRIREELERYRMRDEEIENLIEERVRQKIRQFCEDMEIMEQTPTYKIVKIFKSDSYDFSEAGSKKNESYISINQNRSLQLANNNPYKPAYQSKKQVSVDIATISKEQKQKDKDIKAIQQQLSKEGCNFEDVVSKISSTLENSEMKLKELREQRKKIFLDEDIWDQFEKI